MRTRIDFVTAAVCIIIPEMDMTNYEGMTSESARIQLLIDRDGDDRARLWIERTLTLYRAAVGSPTSHASLPHYRPLFEQAIRDFEQWLARQSGEQTEV